MPASMSLSSLTNDIRLSLLDSASIFDSADSQEQQKNYSRLITAAVADMYQVRPRSMPIAIDLVADVSSYSVPDNMCGFKYAEWGYASRQAKKPWDPNYSRTLPVVTFQPGETNVLTFSPAPSANDIGLYGSVFSCWMYVSHHWSEDGTTSILLSDRELLLFRVVIEAVKSIALRNLNRSGQVKVGIGGSRQGEPSVIYQNMLREFLAS